MWLASVGATTCKNPTDKRQHLIKLSTKGCCLHVQCTVYGTGYQILCTVIN